MNKVSDLVGETVVINNQFKGEFYYECENGMDFDYDFLDENGWKGIVVDVSSGMNVNVVVVVGEGENKRYFELEDMEVMVYGECMSSWVDEWDWENVVSDFEYDCESGYVE